MAIKNRHWLIMIVCCLLAMLAIVILPKYFNFGSLAFLLILLCPLFHIVLMKLMMSKKTKKAKNSCH